MNKISLNYNTRDGL